MRTSPVLRAATALAGSLLVGAALAPLTGCSSHAVETRPAANGSTAPASALPSGSAASAPAPSGSASPGTPAASQARVGDTLELPGVEQGARMAVTVTRVVDPAAAADQFSTPRAGNKIVAVQFGLRNTGTAVYSDSPSNGARVVDGQGQVFDADILVRNTAGPALPASVTVAPGDTALGFVAFQLPADSSVAKVQFTLASGFAGTTGQWLVDASAKSSDPAAARPTAGTPQGSPASPTATAGTAAEARRTVEAYYAAVNARDYEAAWALGGRNLSPSYQDYRAGFATTARVDLTVTTVDGPVVGVVLDALQSDGSHRVFSGSYTVRGGVIVSADIH